MGARIRVAVALGIALLATELVAQRVVRRRNAARPAANKFIRLLELADRRGGALTALRAMGREAVPGLIGALEHPRQEVRLAAMAGLASLGPHAAPAIMALQRLTKSKEPAIAHAAEWALLQVTPRTTTLVADYSASRLVELDADGKELLSIRNLPGCWSAKRIPGGNYLVTEYGTDKVREITPAGKELWSFAGNSPLDAVRLINGNNLIALWHGEKVVEVDRRGKVVWQMTGVQAVDADRLVNGNTLVVDRKNGNRVFEITAAKEIVWELDLDSDAIDADRLPNGHTLVTFDKLNAVREYSRAGAVIRELKIDESPEDAERLLNGHTLVAAQGGIREYDAAGHELRRFKFAQTGDVER